VHKTTLGTNDILTNQKLRVLEGKAYLGIKIQFKTVQHFFFRSWYHTTCMLSVSLSLVLSC